MSEMNARKVLLMLQELNNKIAKRAEELLQYADTPSSSEDKERTLCRALWKFYEVNGDETIKHMTNFPVEQFK